MPRARGRKGAKKGLPELVRRNRAIERTKLEFAGMKFELGRADCVQLARFHLAQMGHKDLPSAKGYSSPAGATKALKVLGFKDLEGLFDSLLERIPPAFMRPGDIGLVQAEEGAPAWRAGVVVISIGRKFLGWHPDAEGLAIIEPKLAAPFLAAWRA